MSRMHPSAILLCAVAALFPCRAAETAVSHLPPLQAHASLASSKEFIAKLDKLTVAAMAGGSREIKPGIVSAVLRSAMALPEGSWRDDEPMHFLFLSHRSSPDNVAMIVSADGLESLAADLDAQGIETTAGESDGRNAVFFSSFSGSPMVAVELDGERLAIAYNEETIGIVLEHLASGAWRPEHDGDADLSVVFPLPGAESTQNPMRAVLTELRNHREDLLAELASMNVNPKLGEAVLAILEKRLPAVGEEMTRIRSVALDLRLAENSLLLGVRPGLAPGAYMETMAASLDRVEPGEKGFPENMRADDWVFAGGSSPETILPGVGEWVRDACDELTRALLPERGPGLSDAVAGTLAALGNGWSMVIGGERGAPAAAAVLDLPSAEFLPVWDGLVESANNLFAALFLAPSLHIGITGQDAPEGGREYRLSFRDPQYVDSLFEFMRRESASFTLSRADVEKGAVRIIGETGGRTVMTAGIGERTRGAAEDGRTGDARRLETFRNLLRQLTRRQAGFAVFEADRLFEVLFIEAAKRRLAGQDAEKVALYIEAIARLIPGLRKSSDWIGVGIGARNGGIVLEVAIPHTVINALVLNHELFARTLPAGSGIAP